MLYRSNGTTLRDDLLARLGENSLCNGGLDLKRRADAETSSLEHAIAAAWTESLAGHAKSWQTERAFGSWPALRDRSVPGFMRRDE